MTATIQDLRAGIKQALERIPGLHATATEPAQIRFPAAWPVPSRYDEAEDFEGEVTYTFDVLVLVSVGDINRAQTALDAFISRSGSNSVRAALMVNEAVRAVRFVGDYRTVDTTAGKALGARFEVDLWG